MAKARWWPTITNLQLAKENQQIVNKNWLLPGTSEKKISYMKVGVRKF
jgi:hypothetical protein